MNIVSSRHPGWLSNTFLVFDQPGGHAVVIDSGGPFEPITAQIEEHRLTLTHLLCTHHHYDHIAHNADYQKRYGCPVCGHPDERSLFGDLDIELGDGVELRSGDLHIRALHIPGHTLGQLGFLIDDTHVFTGDTLFRGSVGGTRGPGHTTFEDLRHSILEVLMKLPSETIVHPGHMEDSTIEEEWKTNPFIRNWRGLDEADGRRCQAAGHSAELIVNARDYDGGRKCFVRFDDGRLDIVPGSRVSVQD
ncbi:MAG: MBL fold metallo-hydrolase [Planctomycetota bacterium]